MPDAPQQPDPSRWRLILHDGSDAGQVFPITGDLLTIGRDLDNDVRLDDLYVSKHHARLTWQGEQLIIQDLDSLNGTVVNDERITEPYVLHPGDIISLGPFTFKVDGPPGEISQTPLKTSTPPIPGSRPVVGPGVLIAAGLSCLMAMVLIVVIGANWLLPGHSSTVVEAPDETATPAVPTIVVNLAPPDNSQVRVDQLVALQARASDPAGVTRMELWVNSEKVDEVTSQLAQEAASMTAAFQWSPATPGPYTIEIRAYNQLGLAGVQPVTSVTAVGRPDTPTPQPTGTPPPTTTPLPPSPTPTNTPTATPTGVTATPVPSTPSLTIKVPALSVRSGPSTQYGIVGQLTQDSQAEIVGQANVGQGQWWQIRFDPAPGGLGWVTGDPDFSVALNSFNVPRVTAPSLPTVAPTSRPSPTPTIVAPGPAVIQAPEGKTLLIVSNRSMMNQPARLTLSGGKSVGGGRELDPLPNGEIRIVLEPDFYRALWSSPARSGGFVRGADFTAVAGKVMVMWIVPEEGRTGTETYNELTAGGAGPAPAVTPAPATPVSSTTGRYVAASGQALLVAANRSLANRFAVLTLAGGSFGGGKEFTLDANTETPIDMPPGSYRAVWNTPARGGFATGRELTVSAGEVILSWIIPEEGQVFMQFPDREPQQINN